MSVITVNPGLVRLTVAPIGNQPRVTIDDTGITAGTPIYIDEDGLAQIASNTSEETAAVFGIALNTGTDGQTILVAQRGILTISDTNPLVPGMVIVLGFGGQIMALEGLAAGDWFTLIGFAVGPNEIRLAITPSGMQYAEAPTP